MKIQTARPPIPPIAAIIFGIAAVSTSAIFIRFAQENASSLVIAAYRLFLATAILIPAAMGSSRQEIRRLDRKQVLLAVLSGIFLAFHFATWISSLAYTTVASSVVLVDTSPLWVALLSPFVLHEKIQRMVIVGMLISLVGGVCIGLSDVCMVQGANVSCPSLPSILDGEYFLGDLLALLGAFFATGYLLIGRQLRPKMTTISYTFLVYGISALVLIAVVGISKQSITGFPPITYVWFLALAIIPQLLGHSTFNWTLRYFSAAFVSIALLGEPIGSTILAYLILGEVPPVMKIAGGILILGGIVMASLA